MLLRSARLWFFFFMVVKPQSTLKAAKQECEWNSLKVSQGQKKREEVHSEERLREVTRRGRLTACRWVLGDSWTAEKHIRDTLVSNYTRV